MRHIRLSPESSILYYLLSGLTLAGCTHSDACPGILKGGWCLEVSRLAIDFGPRALIYIDLDGDGASDLVAANHESGTLSVIWGSDAEFDVPMNILPVAGEIAGIAVADFNDDGHLDLATALPADDAVGVLLGGDGRTFSELRRHRVGPAPRSLLAADLDAAGPPELVTANVGDGSVSILRGLGEATHVAVGPGPRGLAAGDFDGDDDLDLVVALAEADAVQVLLNDGRGRLSLGLQHAVGAAPQAVVVADFDLDGALDLASVSGFEDTVSVLRGDNKGGLRGQATWASIPQPSDLVVVAFDASPPVLGVLSAATSLVQRLDPVNGAALFGATTPWASAFAAGTDGSLIYGSEMDSSVGRLVPGAGLRLTTLWLGRPMARGWPLDLDGDGMDELVFSEKLIGPLELWRNGPGSEVELDTGLAAVWGARAGDLTGDISRELVVWDTQEVAVLQRDSDFLYTAGPPIAVGGTIIDVVLGDADGNGRLDVLVLSGLEAMSQLLWLVCDPDGALQVAAEFPLGFEATSLQAVAGAGDLRADLVLTDGEGHVHYLEDMTEPTRTLGFSAAHSFEAAAYGDLERNGDLDVVTCGMQGLRAFRGILAQKPASPEVLSAAACNGVQLTDLDADDALDVVARTDVAGQSIHSRTLLTPWIQGDLVWTPLGSESMSDTWSFSFAQLDDDGISDLVIINKERETEARHVALGPALMETEPTAIDTPRQFRVGDVDGDGAADLVGVGATLSLALADGRGRFGPLHQPLVTGPLAGAALADVVLVESSGETGGMLIVAIDEALVSRLFVVTFNAGRATAQPLASLPAGDVRLYAHDLDDDGMVDIAALARGQELAVHVLLGRVEGGFEPPRATVLAAPAPVGRLHLHDLDGDGLSDLVGASAAGILWFRGQERGGFAPGEIRSPALADDLVPADLDGDGSTEFVLLRQQTLSVLRGDQETGPLLEEVTSVALADLDTDGRSELLAATNPVNLAGSTVTLHIGRHDADAKLRFSDYHLKTGFVRAIHLANVDGDTDLDIVLVDDVGVTIMRQVP